MKVRATKLGYYEHKRRKEGAVFTLISEKDFSKNWMEPVGSAGALKEEHLDEDEPAKPRGRGRKGKQAESADEDVG